MRDCPVEIVEGKWTCPVCNWVYPLQSEVPPKRNCPNAPSRGLGDSIAKLTRILHIKQCGGCPKRQKLLNRLVSYEAISKILPQFIRSYFKT